MQSPNGNKIHLRMSISPPMKLKMVSGTKQMMNETDAAMLI
jgi:hypothetical protein